MACGGKVGRVVLLKSAAVAVLSAAGHGNCLSLSHIAHAAPASTESPLLAVLIAIIKTGIPSDAGRRRSSS